MRNSLNINLIKEVKTLKPDEKVIPNWISDNPTMEDKKRKPGSKPGPDGTPIKGGKKSKKKKKKKSKKGLKGLIKELIKELKKLE